MRGIDGAAYRVCAQNQRIVCGQEFFRSEENLTPEQEFWAHQDIGTRTSKQERTTSTERFFGEKKHRDYPTARCHNRAVLSADPDSKDLPSGENATALTAFE